MKLASADVYRFVAEPSPMDVTPPQMLDDTYLSERGLEKYEQNACSAHG